MGQDEEPEDDRGSVTVFIHDLVDADRRDDAARRLWETYFADLKRHALKKLQSTQAPRGLTDEEDAAARAFTKVCLAIEKGTLKVENRVALRKLLLWSTTREALRDLTHRLRGKRGGGKERPESSLGTAADHESGGLLDRVAGREPTPDQILQAEDACRQLLASLGDDRLRTIALGKLAGQTNEQLARRLDCSLATIERQVGRIRDHWAAFAPPGPARPGPRDATGDGGDSELGSTTTLLRDLSGRE